MTNQMRRLLDKEKRKLFRRAFWCDRTPSKYLHNGIMNTVIDPETFKLQDGISLRTFRSATYDNGDVIALHSANKYVNVNPYIITLNNRVIYVVESNIFAYASKAFTILTEIFFSHYHEGNRHYISPRNVIYRETLEAPCDWVQAVLCTKHCMYDRYVEKELQTKI